MKHSAAFARWSILAWTVVFLGSAVQAQEKYVTPWFQFDMVSGWEQVDIGKDFPSVVGPSYFGVQPKVDILFGTVNQTLEEVSVVSKSAFSRQMPGHTLITQRFFNTPYGFPAFEYYASYKGNRYRYIDVMVEYEGENFLGSFWAFIPGTDVNKTSDGQVLAMLNSVRPAVDGPTITSHPTSTVVEEGGTLTLSVSVTSEAEYTVEWYRNGIPLGIEGTTLTITGFQEAFAGNYWAELQSIHAAVLGVRYLPIEAWLHSLSSLSLSPVNKVGIDFNSPATCLGSVNLVQHIFLSHSKNP